MSNLALSLVRKIAMRLLRDRKLKKRLPNGRCIFVSPDSQLKYLTSTFDADLIDLADQHVAEGSSVWDVGANCGVFAFSCDKARKVVCFEADPFLADLLQKSSDLGDLDVKVEQVAVSASCGTEHFTIATNGRACNHLSDTVESSMAGGTRERISVTTVTLDSQIDKFGPPDVVKIDVEGAEVNVLKGATRLLADIRPLIYIEMCASTQDECTAILTSAGYNMRHTAELNWLCEPDGKGTSAHHAATMGSAAIVSGERGSQINR